MHPVEGLENQGHRRRASAAENNRADGHAIRIVCFWCERRIVRHRSGKTTIRMRRGCFRLRRPAFAFPIETLCRRWTVLAFPPHIQIGSERNIGEDCVASYRRHCVGVGS